MKKVCFIISGIAYSGAEIVLNRYLDSNPFIDPYFVIIYNSKVTIDKLEKIYGVDKVKCLNIKYNKNLIRFIPYYCMDIVSKALDKILKDINPEVLYANNTIEAMLLYKYIKNNNIKSIAHIHDMKRNFKSFITKYAIKKSLKEYNKVINVSNANKEEWNIKDSCVIYNGLNKNYFLDRRLYSEIKNIGFIGALINRKGIDIILNNIDFFIKKEINLHIVFSGYEKKNYEILNNIASIYPNLINIYKNLNTNEIKKILDNIDLLIVPSRQDPLPTVIMEAMARGVITIGNNIDGIPEMLENKYLLFNKNTLFDKVNSLINLEKCKLQNLSDKSIEIARNKFLDEDKKRKVNKIIEEI